MQVNQDKRPAWVQAHSKIQTHKIITALHDDIIRLYKRDPDARVKLEQDIKASVPELRLTPDAIFTLRNGYRPEAYFQFFTDVLLNAEELGGIDLVAKVVSGYEYVFDAWLRFKPSDQWLLPMYDEVLNHSVIRALYNRPKTEQDWVKSERVERLKARDSNEFGERLLRRRSKMGGGGGG